MDNVTNSFEQYVAEQDAAFQGKVVVTIGGTDRVFSHEDLSINFDDSSAQIIAALQGMIDETLEDSEGNVAYGVRKSTESRNIFVYPKPGAGKHGTF